MRIKKKNEIKRVKNHAAPCYYMFVLRVVFGLL